jgi:sulfite exporter TauE/SafE
MMLSTRLLRSEQILTGASYGLLFITGLLTSLHCVAMCGGITLSQVSVGRNFRMRSATLMQYHLGRIVSYSLTGVIMGAIGAVAAPNDMVRGIVTLAGGVGMALFALSGIYPRWFSRVRLPNFAANLSRSKGKWSRSSLGSGLSTGLFRAGLYKECNYLL